MSTSIALQQKELRNKIISYKEIAEANIMAILYHSPDLYYNCDVTLKDFTSNTWKVYFAILEGCMSEGKTNIDEIVIGQYLELHTSLAQKYNEYGEYQTIKDMKMFAKIGNLESEVANLKKWGVVLDLQASGFPMSTNKLSHYADITIDEIYDEISGTLNNVFVSTTTNAESEDVFDNLEEHINELDKGVNLGVRPYNSNELYGVTGGLLHLGHITSLGALSGAGKSLLSFLWLIPTCIKEQYKIVFIINEEDVARFRTELIVWWANNMLSEKPTQKLTKNVMRNGHFDNATRTLLTKCIEDIKRCQHEHLFTIIPLQKWSVSRAEKIIKKYAAMGVSLFVIDTFKSDSDAFGGNTQEWQQLAQSMSDLYDIIKPASLNVALLTTYQLAKSASRQRLFANDNIGKAKNLIDTVSLNVMIRRVASDEYSNGSHALRVYRWDNASGRKQKVAVNLDDDKTYLICFVTKNRFGASDDYQLIYEINMATNELKEIGFTRIIEEV